MKDFAERVTPEMSQCGNCAYWMTPHCPFLDDAENDILKATDQSCSDFYPSPYRDGDKKKRSVVDRLIHLALDSGVELFEDDRGVPCAVLDGGGHHEVHPVTGGGFERWLRKRYYQKRRKGLRRDTLNNACATLAAIAQFQEPHQSRSLHNRVAWHQNHIYYDLADEKWNAIHITPEGWKINRDPPPLFRRFQHQQPQVHPAEHGDLDLLFQFLNISDSKNRLLMKVYTVCCLVPDIPHPVLLILGPQGCGKSDLMRIIRKLIDPSKVLLQSFSYNQLEMALKIFHHYLVYFDNLTTIKQWLSDMLCRACTGQGFTKRKLYTDQESVIFQFQRCLGVNGIALSQLSPDFLDRCLTINLNQIPPEKRRHEKELWQEFEKARPKIFAGILDALSKALQIYPQVNIERLPRMADFAVWGEAISRALGYQPGEFITAYREKIGEQVADVLEQNPIGLAILAFMEHRKHWEGAPSELLEILEDPVFVEENKIDVGAKKWPGSASWVTRRIKEIETNLEHEGVKFSTKRVKGRRIIVLEKREDVKGDERGYGSDGKDGIFHTKKDENQPVKHDKNIVNGEKVSTGNGVHAVMPTPQTYKRLTRLTTNVRGECVLCGFRGRMDWQMTLFDDDWEMLCEGCGRKLRDRCR